MIIDVEDPALESRARRAAKRVGLRARKSRWRLGTIDNRGGFQLLDPYRNWIVAGEKLDMSAEDVIAYCASREGPQRDVAAQQRTIRDLSKRYRELRDRKADPDPAR